MPPKLDWRELRNLRPLPPPTTPIPEELSPAVRPLDDVSRVSGSNRPPMRNAAVPAKEARRPDHQRNDQGRGAHRSRLVMEAPAHHHAGPWQWQFAAPKAPAPKIVRKVQNGVLQTKSVDDLEVRLKAARRTEEAALRMLKTAREELLVCRRAVIDRYLRTHDVTLVPSETVLCTVNLVSAFLRAKQSIALIRNHLGGNKLHVRRHFPRLELDASTLNQLEEVAIDIESPTSTAAELVPGEAEYCYENPCYDSCEVVTEEEGIGESPALDGKAVTHMIELFDAMYDAETFELHDFATPQRARAATHRCDDVKDETQPFYDSLAFDADRRSATQDRLYREVCEDEARQSVISTSSPFLNTTR